jgi:hypothetical protein
MELSRLTEILRDGCDEVYQTLHEENGVVTVKEMDGLIRDITNHFNVFEGEGGQAIQALRSAGNTFILDFVIEQVPKAWERVTVSKKKREALGQSVLKFVESYEDPSLDVIRLTTYVAIPNGEVMEETRIWFAKCPQAAREWGNFLRAILLVVFVLSIKAGTWGAATAAAGLALWNSATACVNEIVPDQARLHARCAYTYA